MKRKKIILKAHEERRIKAGHLWAFSNEIDTLKSPLKEFSPGEIVDVYDFRETPLGSAYVNPHSLICVRLFSKRIGANLNKNLIVERLKDAKRLREVLFDKPFYRAFYADADRLPGLVLDRYDKLIVCQIYACGLEKALPDLIDAICEVYKPDAILLKNDAPVRSLEGLDLYVDPIMGEVPEEITVPEGEFNFKAPLLKGQKTGWYYDQRANRDRLIRYVKDCSVLDCFCYVGAWGIRAFGFGAKRLCFIDSSSQAMEFVKENTRLNNIDIPCDFIVEDAVDALTKLVEQGEKFDVVLLDPPALIKNKKFLHVGKQAYVKLNRLSMKLIKSGGFLVASSCSYHLNEYELKDVIRRAALQEGRCAKIVEKGGQGLDHPIHPTIPESYYLKTYYVWIG